MADSDQTGGGDVAAGATKTALWQAFLAGFATGRSGKHYQELEPISERAARSEFEQYYRTRTARSTRAGATAGEEEPPEDG